MSVASAVLTGAIDASTQAILEKMADKCRASIIEWEQRTVIVIIFLSVTLCFCVGYCIARRYNI